MEQLPVVGRNRVGKGQRLVVRVAIPLKYDLPLDPARPALQHPDAEAEQHRIILVDGRVRRPAQLRVVNVRRSAVHLDLDGVAARRGPSDHHARRPTAHGIIEVRAVGVAAVRGDQCADGVRWWRRRAFVRELQSADFECLRAKAAAEHYTQFACLVATRGGDREGILGPRVEVAGENRGQQRVARIGFQADRGPYVVQIVRRNFADPERECEPVAGTDLCRIGPGECPVIQGAPGLGSRNPDSLAESRARSRHLFGYDAAHGGKGHQRVGGQQRLGLKGRCKQRQQAKRPHFVHLHSMTFCMGCNRSEMTWSKTDYRLC